MKRKHVVKCAAANDDDSEEVGKLEIKPCKTEPPSDHNQDIVSTSKENKSKRQKEFAWMDSDDEDSCEKDVATMHEIDTEDELLETSVEGLQKLTSFGRVMLALPALTRWLKSGNLSCQEVVSVCQVFKSTKFFDSEVFKELYTLLCDFLQKKCMDAEQAYEVIVCLHALNAYDQQVFSAVARSYKDKIDDIDPYVRSSWFEIFTSCGHKADPGFLHLLQASSKPCRRRTDTEEHGKNPQGAATLGGEGLVKINGIPRYWPSQMSKQRFDWEDTSWLSADEKTSYVKRVKTFKKRGFSFVQAWYNFCKSIGFEYTDPAWHTVENMRLFLSEMEALERELPAGASHDFFFSRLDQAFNGGISPSASDGVTKPVVKPTDPALADFISKWKLHLDAQRLLASLPDHVTKRVITEFAPKDTSRDVNGLFMKFAKGKQEYLELREADGKARSS